MCCGVGVDVVFEAYPGDEESAEDEVEESFVGDGQDDEDGREGQENHDETMEVMIVRLEAVEKREA